MSGHPGISDMLDLLREPVWWPGMTRDVDELVKMYNLRFAAAIPRNVTPPMGERKTPERPWQHCLADYKGSIGCKFYFHVLIDNYSH